MSQATAPAPAPAPAKTTDETTGGGKISDAHEVLVELPVRVASGTRYVVRAWLDWTPALDAPAINRARVAIAEAVCNAHSAKVPNIAAAILANEKLRKLVSAAQVSHASLNGVAFVSYRDWPK